MNDPVSTTVTLLRAYLQSIQFVRPVPFVSSLLQIQLEHYNSSLQTPQLFLASTC